MIVGGVVKWDTLQGTAPTKIHNQLRHIGKLHHTLEAETPISRSLLNEFFNKRMHSERKQEIAKVKLKRARQQLNIQANWNQVQVGGGNIPVSPAKAMPTPTVPPVVTPLPANVPRKAHVGRPAGVAKPKPPPLAAATGSKKAPQPKPLVTRSKVKNQPIPANVAVTDPENDTTAPVDLEYDTDELAELPTDSEPETTESEPGKRMLKFKGNDN